MSLTTNEWAGRGSVSQARRIRYLVFGSIIAASSLCYCAGFAALSFAPSNRIVFITETATVTRPPIASAEATLSATPTQSASPTPTSSPTVTPTDTPTPSETPTLTATLEPTATATPTDTPAPTDTPTPTAQPEPITYILLIAVRGDDRGVFVINQTADTFPLAPLQLADGSAAVEGSEWGIESLVQDECVSVWRDTSKPNPPRGITCTHVGASVVRSGPDRFWRSAFNVYYAGELIAQCGSNRCEISLAIQP